MSKEIELSKEDFRKMQLIELELLKEFDRVCRLHNIPYVITDGTMLGAVRHKGFMMMLMSVCYVKIMNVLRKTR